MTAQCAVPGCPHAVGVYVGGKLLVDGEGRPICAFHGDILVAPIPDPRDARIARLERQRKFWNDRYFQLAFAIEREGLERALEIIREHESSEVVP